MTLGQKVAPTPTPYRKGGGGYPAPNRVKDFFDSFPYAGEPHTQLDYILSLSNVLTTNGVTYDEVPLLSQAGRGQQEIHLSQMCHPLLPEF